MFDGILGGIVGVEIATVGEQLHAALGPDLMNQLASRTGIPPEELSAKLAQVLPGAIDKLTPNGTVPSTP